MQIVKLTTDYVNQVLRTAWTTSERESSWVDVSQGSGCGPPPLAPPPSEEVSVVGECDDDDDAAVKSSPRSELADNDDDETPDYGA